VSWADGRKQRSYRVSVRATFNERFATTKQLVVPGISSILTQMLPDYMRITAAKARLTKRGYRNKVRFVVEVPSEKMGPYEACGAVRETVGKLTGLIVKTAKVLHVKKEEKATEEKEV